MINYKIFKILMKIYITINYKQKIDIWTYTYYTHTSYFNIANLMARVSELRSARWQHFQL